MIKGYKKIIDETLVNYFDEILNKKEHIFAKKTIEAMKYTTCLGGKKLRAEFFQAIFLMRCLLLAPLKCFIAKA